MKLRRAIAAGLALLFLGTLGLAYPSEAEDHPIVLTVETAPDTELAEGGTVSYLTFTLENRSENAYTMYEAVLSGGFDGAERPLNDAIEIEAHGKKEFTLQNVPVRDEQLDTDVIYTLTWQEYVYSEEDIPDPTEEENEPETENGQSELIRTKIERTTNASVRIERFVPPELTLSVTAAQPAVTSGEPFVVTYKIENQTKYDMSSLVLTDPGAYEGPIALPGTDLMAGASISVPVEYTMGEEDMTFRPVLTYIAARRPTETQAKEPLTVGSVVIGVRIDVQQYPSNEEGTTFAITITNTGSRAMKNLQLYDEINTEIDRPFDLGPQQQKVVTFSVPSAYASGLIRTVRFHLSGLDYFNNSFSYIDANSYDCVPFITSDAVRLSLLANLTDAFYDENGKLCGTIQWEIRNYSDVRVTNAVLSELTLFGTVNTYDELQRGETFFVSTYQLDNVPELSFRLSAKDPLGQIYSTDTVVLNLEQLPTLAKRTDEQTLIYHSNAFLKELSDRIGNLFRNVLWVILGLAALFGIICLALRIAEYRITSSLPRESLLSIRVPNAAKTQQTAMDNVLAGSPAEQLGYVVPTKIRYGTGVPQKREPEEPETLGSILFAPLKRQIEERMQPQRSVTEAAEQTRNISLRPARSTEPVTGEPKNAGAAEPRIRVETAEKNGVRVVEVWPVANRRRLTPNERFIITKGGRA